MARRPSPALSQWWVSQILKALREASGLSAAKAGKIANLDPSTISRYERFDRRPQPGHIRSLLISAYGQPAAVANAVAEMAAATHVTPWYAPHGDLPDWLALFAGLEGAAKTIRPWSPLTVPGLLQTEDMAAALIQSGATQPTPEKLAEEVAFRMSRQELLADDDSPEFIAVIAEDALRHPVGGADVMRAQVRHLIEVSTRPHVHLHILRSKVGGHPGRDGAFVLLDFAPAPPIVPPLYRDSVAYLQSARGALYLDEPGDTAAYRAAHDRLVELSTSGDETRELLHKLA